MPRAWVYGDNVDTDAIIPARYLMTTEESVLARHVLENLDRGFAGGVSPGDVVVAGDNFGCGSSREHAPVALKAAGVSAVVAASFARIFFRNAVNTGLPVVVCPAAVRHVRTGDEVSVDAGSARIHNVTRGLDLIGEPLGDFVSDIVNAGGLVEWVRTRAAAGVPSDRNGSRAAGSLRVRRDGQGR